MREADQALFRAVHEIAVRHSGEPVPDVIRVLTDQLPPAPGIASEEIQRIAEEISAGRDPSGLRYSWGSGLHS